jgi:cytidine deaminase
MKEPIHALKVNGGADKRSVTVCGRPGMRIAATTMRYATERGSFLAVDGSDPKYGSTCGRCRQVMAIWKDRGRVIL